MVARGEVWWVDFAAPLGSEPAKRRPAVVVSDDRFNRSRLNTVTLVAVTSNVTLAARPGNVSLPQGAAGLDRPSVVNVTQIATVDRQRLMSRSGCWRELMWHVSTTACAWRFAFEPELGVAS